MLALLQCEQVQRPSVLVNRKYLPLSRGDGRISRDEKKGGEKREQDRVRRGGKECEDGGYGDGVVATVGGIEEPSI